jgi:hypothetical protein
MTSYLILLWKYIQFVPQNLYLMLHCRVWKCRDLPTTTALFLWHNEFPVPHRKKLQQSDLQWPCTNTGNKNIHLLSIHIFHFSENISFISAQVFNFNSQKFISRSSFFITLSLTWKILFEDTFNVSRIK